MDVSCVQQSIARLRAELAATGQGHVGLSSPEAVAGGERGRCGFIVRPLHTEQEKSPMTEMDWREYEESVKRSGTLFLFKRIRWFCLSNSTIKLIQKLLQDPEFSIIS